MKIDPHCEPPAVPHEVFETSDYGVSGYLFASGFDYEQLRQEGTQVIFSFAASSALTLAVSDYLSNKPIGARDLFHGLRKAKGLVLETIQGRIQKYAHHGSR